MERYLHSRADHLERAEGLFLRAVDGEFYIKRILKNVCSGYSRKWMCGILNSTNVKFLSPNALVEEKGLIIKAIPAYNRLKPFHTRGKFTMDYKEAAKFVNFIAPKLAIPTHCGTIVGSPKDGKRFAELVNKQIEVRITI